MTCHQPVGQADILSDVPPPLPPQPPCHLNALLIEQSGGQELY